MDNLNAISLAGQGHKIMKLSADNPDNKVHGAYMGPTWGQQDPGGPHVGPMILSIWEGKAIKLDPDDIQYTTY